MFLVNTVSKIPGRKAVSEHPRMPKLFHYAVLAQEENYCSQDQSVNFQQASGNCAPTGSGWVMTRINLVINLVICYVFVSQKWRNLCFTHWLSRLYKCRSINSAEYKSARVSVGNHADKDLSPFFGKQVLGM